MTVSSFTQRKSLSAFSRNAHKRQTIPVMTRDLTVYVPRLVVDWFRDLPDLPFRRIDGSVVFVDLSGFTAMSERLSRKGKVGSEEVTAAINSCFSQLLEVAYADGGSLLKFGGDALLLFFSGDDHPLRSVHAATAMRRRLSEMGPISTSAGQVRLRMSVGIHSGGFDFFLVGETHKELIITGPAATMAARMETLASSGEIVVSQQTAGLLPTPALLRQKQDGWLVRRSVPSPAARPSRMFEPDPTIAKAIPVSLREALSDGIGEEHRRVVIGFLHFGGVDSWLEGGRSEEVAGRLEGLLANVQRICDADGVTFLGSDVYEDGGKLILAAGTPTTMGDDEERMLRAMRSIFDSFDDLPLRAGVNSGPVFSGEIGPAFRKTFTVMGDAVNLAARLMQRARPGEIIALEELLDRSDMTYEAHPGEPFLPKGKSLPVTPMSVGRAVGQREQGPAEGPFVGRDEELDRLTSLHASVVSGVGNYVLLTGEAGIGKSRLIAEAMASIPAPRSFRIRSERFAASTPYASVRPVLMRALGLDTADPDALRSSILSAAPEMQPWLPLVGAVVGVDLGTTPEVDEIDTAFRKQRADQVAVDLLAHVCTDATVFLFDDAHWMDDASLGLVERLGTQTNQHPWLVIVSTRPEDRIMSALRPHEHIELEPLPRDAAASLARITAKTPLPPHVIESLVQRSAGNPLYIWELTASGLDLDEDLPATLESLIAARLDSLPSSDRAALSHLSVMGETRIDVDMACKLFDLDRSRVSKLGRFMALDGGFASFRQSLFRQVAYERLPFVLRRRLHAKVATKMSEDPSSDLAVLSMHHYLAREYDEAWSKAGDAGRAAQGRWANVEAASLFRRALDAARYLEVDPRELSETWEELGMVLELNGSYQDALEAFNRARKAAPSEDIDRLSRLNLKQGALNLALGSARSAALHFNRVIRMVEVVPTAEAQKWHNRALLGKAQIELRRGRLASSARIGKRAHAIARKWRDKPGIAHSVNHLHSTYIVWRKPERAEYRGKPIKILEEIGDLRQLGWVLNNIATDYRMSGDWDLALAMHRRGMEVRQRSGDVSGQAVSAFNIAEILSDRGELNEALELLQQARDIWVPGGFELGVALASMSSGRVMVKMGEVEEGEQKIKEAIVKFDSLGAKVYKLEAEARLAEIAVGRGEISSLKAVKELLSVADSTEGSGSVRAVLKRLQGSLLAGACDFDGARKAFDEAVALAEGADDPLEVALSSEVWAKAVPEPEGRREELLAKAASIFERLGVQRREASTTAAR